MVIGTDELKIMNIGFSSAGFARKLLLQVMDRRFFKIFSV